MSKFGVVPQGGWFGVALVLLSGCGKGPYEEKMTQRISQIRSGAGPGGVNWDVFESPSGRFLVEMPSRPTVEDRQGVEKAVATAGDAAYEVYFSATGAPADLNEAAQRVQQQYTSSGYRLGSQNRATVANQTAVELFLTGQGTDTAYIRVCVVDGTDVCTLVARGPDLTREDVDRFFDSTEFL